MATRRMTSDDSPVERKTEKRKLKSIFFGLKRQQIVIYLSSAVFNLEGQEAEQDGDRIF